MYQYDDPTCATTLPTPAAPGTAGYFTDGNPAGGEAATDLRSDFMNMLMMELLNVAEAGGQTPSKTTYNQVLLAIKQMIADLSPGVVGGMRNAKMVVTAAAATATFTADQIIAGTSLAGLQYVLPSFSQTINLAATGANGMDTGTAPASGFVALYAIYNPTTGASALLSTNATNAVVPNVYGGAYMPSGYTASALLSVWRTTSSSLFIGGYQRDREVYFAPVTVLTTSASTGSTLTSLSISAAVPMNALSFGGNLVGTNSSANVQINISVAGSYTGYGMVISTNTNSAVGSGISSTFTDVPLVSPQTAYYTNNVSAGTGTTTMSVNKYSF